MVEIIFILSISSIIYTYFGYPFILFVITKFKSKIVDKKIIHPHLSFIITVFNEEKRIKEKIENTLSQDYPKDRLEIIVTSDCSTDRTHEIVNCYSDKGVKLIVLKERKGKEFAQENALKKAIGDIIIFSDAATILDPDGTTNIVANFNDKTVGCVSSEDKFIDEEGKVSGEGAYVKYEMFLRSLESRVNSLVGLSGSFFAARKEVCLNFSCTMQSDFLTLLNSIKLGLRGVTDPASKGYYKDVKSEKKEIDRKVRTVLRGITVFFNNLSLLNPFRYKLFTFQLISHKLLRWLVPPLLIITFISNIFIIKLLIIYKVVFLLQVIFYLLAYIGYKSKRDNRLCKIPLFFIIVNYSILIAWLKYITGQRITMWKPSQR